MQDEFRFAQGDVAGALPVMKEAARWLAAEGIPLWTEEELDVLPRQNEPGCFLTLRDGEGESAAALLLGFEDRFFWPDVAPGTAGFLHKIAVRRKYAGRGLPGLLIGHVAGLCRERGIGTLRLDCAADRPALRRVYERLGFVPAGEKELETKRLGRICVALYTLDIGQRRPGEE